MNNARMHWKRPVGRKDSAAQAAATRIATCYLLLATCYLLKAGKHKNFQRKRCRLQTSLIAGTLLQRTHLSLSIGFLAIYLISQAWTGLPALDLKRQLGVSYPTAWLIQQKLMQAMVEQDARYTLCNNVQADRLL